MNTLNQNPEVATGTEVGDITTKISEALFAAYHLGRECTHLSDDAINKELGAMSSKLQDDLFSFRVELRRQTIQAQVEEHRQSLLRYIPVLSEREILGDRELLGSKMLPLVQDKLEEVIQNKEYQVVEKKTSTGGEWTLKWRGELDTVPDACVDLLFEFDPSLGLSVCLEFDEEEAAD